MPVRRTAMQKGESTTCDAKTCRYMVMVKAQYYGLYNTYTAAC